MIKAVIFDMDGVIVDSESSWKKYLYKYYRSIIPEFTREELGKMTGFSVEAEYAYLKENHGLSLSFDDFLSHNMGLMPKIYHTVTGFDGVQDYIHSLQGMKLAVASSSAYKYIFIVLERLSIKSEFSVVKSAHDEKCHSKPAPDIFLMAAKDLDVNPSECVVIEDAKNGVIAAKAADMKCIGFQSSDSQDLSMADRIVKDYSELSKINIKGMG